MRRPSAGPVRVLCVGDPDAAASTAAALERESERFAAETATGAGDTLDRLDGGGFDCVVASGRDGAGLVAAVREEHPDIPVVLFAAERGGEVEDALARGVTHYLRRDGDGGAYGPLARCVQNAAERYRSGRGRELVLEELHAVASDITAYEDEEGVCRRTVEAAESVLDFDNCIVFLEEGGELVVAAISDEFPADDLRALPIEGSLAGKTYRTGESFVVDDADAHPIADPQGPYLSGLSVPIGDHGVCQMVSEGRGAFGAEDLELAELLVSHTEGALDRLAREAELRRQNERLDEFVSVVSHDLRNPLNVLDGALELAAETGEDEHFERCRRAIERMERLVEDLLALAREGEDVSEWEQVELARIIDACWGNVETGDATLRVEADRRVRADEGRLRQLLENLIRNAVEHGSTGARPPGENAVEHGSTSPRSETPGDAVEHGGEGVTVTVGDLDGGFYVEDDGPGIPEAERDEVFEAGYTTSDEGTGFGLSIVKRIADAHGWEVAVAEGAEGGARFEITGVETG